MECLRMLALVDSIKPPLLDVLVLVCCLSESLRNKHDECPITGIQWTSPSGIMLKKDTREGIEEIPLNCP